MPSAEGAGKVDLMLYAAGSRAASRPWYDPPGPLLHDSAACFGRVFVRNANLTKEEQFYLGGWDNTGPNNLFYGLMLDPWLHDSYDAVLWMETDMVPIRPPWRPSCRSCVHTGILTPSTLANARNVFNVVTYPNRVR